jgi:hypothetical protein
MTCNICFSKIKKVIQSLWIIIYKKLVITKMQIKKNLSKKVPFSAKMRKINQINYKRQKKNK